MDPRPLSVLFEHHVLPEIRDTISELEQFVQTSEGFFDDLYLRTRDVFVVKEVEFGVSALPDGTSLEHFFKENFAAWPEGRLVRLLRQSIFVATYGFIEFSLMELCRTLRRKDVRITVADLRGQNLIDKARDYISKVLPADFPASSGEWQEIQLFRRVRNSIVHNAGAVSPESTDRNSIEQYARQYPNRLKLDGDNIALEAPFCLRVLEVFRSFLDRLAVSLVSYVKTNEANLESFERQFGEFYPGRPLSVMYIPPPDIPALRGHDRKSSEAEGNA